MVDTNNHSCGFIAIVGRPNVGKSTLLNRLVGQKISITTHKPQTTRHKILGIRTTEKHQMVFVDTPGFHLGESRAINKYMNKAALSVINDVSVILFVVQATRWTEEDKALLAKLKTSDIPIVLLINKIDMLKDKDALLPFIEELNQKYEFQEVIPVSAKTGNQLDALLNRLEGYLPLGEPLYDEDQITDKSMRFLAAEIIREKLFLRMQQEIPYALTVEIESFKEADGLLKIHAAILVERSTQKSIVIGKKGQSLKDVGSLSRKAMEILFEKKVFLQLWVKVKEGWSDDERALQSLGFNFD